MTIVAAISATKEDKREGEVELEVDGGTRKTMPIGGGAVAEHDRTHGGCDVGSCVYSVLFLL
jgi:hypothetical protein